MWTDQELTEIEWDKFKYKFWFSFIYSISENSITYLKISKQVKIQM